MEDNTAAGDATQPDPVREDRPERAIPRLKLPRRSGSNSYIGGVAGGIAENLRLDPFIPRAGLLSATLYLNYAQRWIPVVPFVYAVLWLALPAADGPALLRNMRNASARREVVAAVAAFVVVALLLSRPVFGLALALAALAWALLSGNDVPGVSVGSPAESTPGPGAVQARSPLPLPAKTERDSAAGSKWGRARRSERGENLVANFTQRTRWPRRDPALWPATVGLLAIVGVGSLTAAALLGRELQPAVVVNLSLVAIGLIIALSAWRGRATWTALLAVALLPAWIGFSVADIGRFDGVGSVAHTPTEISPSGVLDYAHGFGDMTVDLRDLAFDEGDDVPVRVAASGGKITVLAPFDAEVRVRSKVGFGQSVVHSHGLAFHEYDREPYLDRVTDRRYPAHGVGCRDGYQAVWSHLIERHAASGINFGSLSADSEADVSAILRAIVDAGFAEPLPFSFEAPADQFVQPVGQRPWSYVAGIDGKPCNPQPPPTDPATIEIDATIGIGSLIVNRDEF